MNHSQAFAAALCSALLLTAVAARADDYVLTLQDHAFTPQPLVLPAGQKVTLTVKNLQSTPAEFESSDLDREKVVAAGGQITVKLGPLDAGNYSYVDDFHRDSKGVITVK